MSCAAVAKVLFLDNDTIRTWYRFYQGDGIDGLAGFGTRRRRGRLVTFRLILCPILRRHPTKRVLGLSA